jgi:hypothetical protein
MAYFLSEGRRSSVSNIESDIVLDVREVQRFLSYIKGIGKTTDVLEGWTWFRLPLADDRRHLSLSEINTLESSEGIIGRVEAHFPFVSDQSGNRDLYFYNTASVALPTPGSISMPEDCHLADSSLVFRQRAFEVKFLTRKMLKGGEDKRLGWMLCR